MTQKILNILDVEDLVNKFLLDKQQSIVNLHNLFFKEANKLSYKALVEELFDELKTGCVSFINKNDDLEDLDSYLFYITNAFCKQKYIPPVKKQKEYVCPGCLFLGHQNLITFSINLTCYECTQKLKTATDSKWINFFKTFKSHSKVGLKCDDCERFIPQPLGGESNIVCPYTDCCFVGAADDLKKMIHPTSETTIKHVAIDNVQLSSSDVNALSKIEMEEDFNLKVKLINDVIDQQINTTHWNSFNFTIQHKIFVYQAFKNVLAKHPMEMVPYLLDNSRSGGFQHKVFQEFFSLLEKSFPLPFKKNGAIHQITSLLDENLSLFDGMSRFEAAVTDKCCIKNNTQEFYIGGRKGSYAKPYYIGKLLNVIEADSKNPILHLVQEYSFSKIKLKDVPANTKVIVTHLRVPPHYQMGGMVYVNRIRKKIIDKVQLLLDKNNV